MKHKFNATCALVLRCTRIGMFVWWCFDLAFNGVAGGHADNVASIQL